MIMNMAGGGGKGLLQVKTASPSESSQIILPDTGYDGLSKVNINAISNTYVGTGVNRSNGGTFTPSTSTTLVASIHTYLNDSIFIQGDSALIPSNIKKGSSIFGVNGSYEGEGGYSGSYLNIVGAGQDDTVVSISFNNINTGYSKFDFYGWRCPAKVEAASGYIMSIEGTHHGAGFAYMPTSSDNFKITDITLTESKGTNSTTITVEIPSTIRFYPADYYWALFTYA